MASGVYNRFKYNCMAGRTDLTGSGSHTINCALLDSNHTFVADNNTWTAISANEASGAGYSAGGAILANKTVTQDDVNDRAAFDADDVTWGSSTVTARYAVLYDNTLIAKELVACFDFGQNYSSNNGNFTITWHANGIILLT